jgi:hypothetical protein
MLATKKLTHHSKKKNKQRKVNVMKFHQSEKSLMWSSYDRTWFSGPNKQEIVILIKFNKSCQKDHGLIALSTASQMMN